METISTLQNQSTVTAQHTNQVAAQPSSSSHSSGNELANKLETTLTGYIINDNDRLKKLNKQLKNTLKGSSTQLTKYITIENSTVVATKDFPEIYDKDNQAKVLNALIKGHGSVAGKNKSHLREAIKGLVKDNPALGLEWQRGGKIIIGSDIGTNSDTLYPVLSRPSSASAQGHTDSDASQETVPPLEGRDVRQATSSSGSFSSITGSGHAETENANPLGENGDAVSLTERKVTTQAAQAAQAAQASLSSITNAKSGQQTESDSDLMDENKSDQARAETINNPADSDQVQTEVDSKPVISSTELKEINNLRKTHIEHALEQYANTKSKNLSKALTPDAHAKEVNRITQALNKEFPDLEMDFDFNKKAVNIKGQFPDSNPAFIKMLDTILGTYESKDKNQHNTSKSSLETLLTKFNTKNEADKILSGIIYSSVHKEGITGIKTFIFREGDSTNNNLKISETKGKVRLIDNPDKKAEAKLELSKNIIKEVEAYNGKIEALKTAFLGGDLVQSSEALASRLNKLFPETSSLSNSKRITTPEFKAIEIKALDNNQNLSSAEISRLKTALKAGNDDINKIKSYIDNFMESLSSVAKFVQLKNNMNIADADFNQTINRLKTHESSYEQFLDSKHKNFSPIKYFFKHPMKGTRALFFRIVANNSSWDNLINADKTDSARKLNSIKNILKELNNKGAMELNLNTLDDPKISTLINLKDLSKVHERLEKKFQPWLLGLGKAKRVALEKYIAHEFNIDRDTLVSMRTHDKRKGVGHRIKSGFSNMTTRLMNPFSK